MGQFPKILWTENMFKLYLLVVSLAAVLSAPLEDTADVVAAKAEFQAAFDMAAEGRLGELAPVNNDVQAEQIATAYMADTDDVAAAKVEFQSAFVQAEQIAAAYMADTEDVAAAKAEFMAAFEDAEAGVQAAVAPMVEAVAAPEVEEVAAPEAEAAAAPVVNALPMHYLLPYAPAYTYSVPVVHHLGAYALPYAYPLTLAPMNEEASEPAVESA